MSVSVRKSSGLEISFFRHWRDHESAGFLRDSWLGIRIILKNRFFRTRTFYGTPDMDPGPEKFLNPESGWWSGKFVPDYYRCCDFFVKFVIKTIFKRKFEQHFKIFRLLHIKTIFKKNFKQNFNFFFPKTVDDWKAATDDNLLNTKQPKIKILILKLIKYIYFLFYRYCDLFYFCFFLILIHWI